MRVVFDTNIFISALLFPGGRAEEALLRVIEGKDQLLVSRSLIHELVGVLAKKFSVTGKSWRMWLCTCPKLQSWFVPGGG